MDASNELLNTINHTFMATYEALSTSANAQNSRHEETSLM